MPADLSTWLPQPSDWAELSVARQTGDPGSMLELYRQALAVRRTRGLGPDPEFSWAPAPDDVLAFRRPGGLTCLVNLSDGPVDLPPRTTTVLSSLPLASDGRLPPDVAVWLVDD
jgi:alpha-glucosidase